MEHLTLNIVFMVMFQLLIEVSNCQQYRCFIPSVEQMTTAKDFIMHRLVLDLNHLDRGREDIRFKNSLAFQDEPKFFCGVIYLRYMFNKERPS